MDTESYSLRSGQKRPAMKSFAKRGRKKQKLSNRWFLDGVYSDLPMQGYTSSLYGFFHFTSLTGCDRLVHYEKGRPELIKTGHSLPFLLDFWEPIQSVAEMSMSELSHQQLTSQSSLPWDPEDYQSCTSSLATVISASPQYSQSFGPREWTPPTTKAGPRPRELPVPHGSRSRQRPDASPLLVSQTSPLKETDDDFNCQGVPDTSPFEASETKPLLWPLPAGEPVLPPSLQAVPYPTSSEIRPPMSPIQQHRTSTTPLPSLPHIDQFVFNSPRNPIYSACRPQTGTPAHSEEGVFDESFVDLSAAKTNAVDQTSLEALRALAHGVNQENLPSEKPYGTPVETEGGWRLGLMRLHREPKIYTREWEPAHASDCAPDILSPRGAEFRLQVQQEDEEIDIGNAVVGI